MSNEEFERQMEFILQQQAKFAARFDDHFEKQREIDAAANARLDRIDGQLKLLLEAIVGLTHHVERHEHHVERHDYEMAEIRRTLAEQAQRGKETDSRLNALMVVVERHITGHQSSA